MSSQPIERMEVDMSTSLSNSLRSSVSKRPQKVPVARSDFHNAMEAMQQALSSAMREKPQRDSSKTDNDNNKENEMQDTKGLKNFAQQNDMDNFRGQIQRSLEQHLGSIVDPISDDDYHRLACTSRLEYQCKLEEIEERRQRKQIKKAFEEQRLEKKQALEKAFDPEEDLLDSQAYERAQQLRVQVRDMVNRVQDLQTQILQRAVGLVQRETKLLAKSSSTTSSDNHNVLEKCQKSQTIIEEMENSLQSLQKALSHHNDAGIQQNLNKMEATVQVVRKTVDEPMTLSQTEEAILSRTNEGSHTQNLSSVIEIDDSHESQSTSPEAILADYLMN